MSLCLQGHLSLASYLVLKIVPAVPYLHWWFFPCFILVLAQGHVICSIVSIQNLSCPSSAILCNPLLWASYTPLAFTLFFGRTLLCSVCPSEQIQMSYFLRPLVLRSGSEKRLRLLAYYISAPLFFAATNSAFLICRYDRSFHSQMTTAEYADGGAFL